MMNDYTYIVTDDSKVSYKSFYILHISYSAWCSLALELVIFDLVGDLIIALQSINRSLID